MFQKIVHYIDKKHFGDQVLIYLGNVNQGRVYFVIIKDREEIVFYFVNSNLERMYPVNSYIGSQITLDFNAVPDALDIACDIDFSQYGYSKCPLFLMRLISDNIQEYKN